MLRHFGLCVGLLVGLYYGLGHFSVVELWSIQVVFQKNIVNTKQTAIFGLRCWCFWCFLFCSVFSLFLGACCTWATLALSQAHVEKKSSHVELLLRPFQPMLGQCGATLVYVGTVLGHVVSSIGPMLCWAYVDACCTNMEPCCPMLGRCWLMWGRP